MKISKLILLLLGVCLLGSVYAAETKPILLAAEPTYPPFESMNNQGQLVGFDVDVLTAICSKMNLSCKFVSQAWDSLMPSLKLGKFDVIFGCMGITEERKKQIDFTKSYYENTASFVAAKGANFSIDPKEIKNKIIGVQSSTTYEYYLQTVYGSKIEIKRYGSYQDALLDLKAGRVDAILADTPILQEWLKSPGNTNYALLGKPFFDAKFFGEGNGFAVKKGNTELLQKLNQGIDAIKADGTYQKIYQKYFGSAE